VPVPLPVPVPGYTRGAAPTLNVPLSVPVPVPGYTQGVALGFHMSALQAELQRSPSG
jgi:hypothetical protein